MTAPNVVHMDGKARPAPPYPADTRSGNYHLALDVNRVHQSTTWKLASAPDRPPEVKAWVLALWFEAWTQIPVGSLPRDDESIAAIVGMPLRVFTAHRTVFLRGWRIHADMRLYHTYLTELVLVMLEERDRFAKSKRKGRKKHQASDVSTWTPRGLPVDAHVDVDVDVHRVHPHAVSKTTDSGTDTPLQPPTASAGAVASDLDGIPCRPPPQRQEPAAAEPPTASTWTHYAAAYAERYGVHPVRNATVNGQLANLVSRLGSEAPAVAGYYVTRDDQRYQKARHSAGLLLHDAEALRMEWATGRGKGPAEKLSDVGRRTADNLDRWARENPSSQGDEDGTS